MRGFSQSITYLRESPTRRIDAIRERLKRESRDIINLSAGQPGLPPPIEVRSLLAKQLVEENSMELYGYTPSQGILELREAVSEDLKRLGGINIDPGNIVIITGGQEGMFATFMTILNPGDEVILLDPTYFGYKPIIEYFGGRIKRLGLRMDDGFRIDIEKLKELVTNRTKALVIVSPDNPTGNIIDRDTAKAIADLARDENFWIISDEAYRTLIYEGEHTYMYRYAPDNVISINTFSKDPGIPGWRLGFIYGPSDAIPKLKLAAEEMTYCPPVIAQKFVSMYLRSEARMKHMRYIVEEYRSRRDAAIESLRNYLPEARFIVPRGSMFVFADLSNYISNSEKFAEVLLEKFGVTVIPGTYFSDIYKSAIRISFVVENADRIRLGIKRIHDAINEYGKSL
ncbi:pyridoxal phosphate-dependent aminotransferase [Vulcanisaeta souniana]|uniref:Aspartate aminotransferase n=1 Tax=Vulcanisaeta souniana JCM 11219 TaxID=1293586 RepID=A0A830EIG5_9CREN|nr:pyridoxal phosphate-dependent aminotransferase [Vulcanisaeta souniana]BDR92326.1 aspartate aminotransferase [Vulcanisaeta souniana JCM 11219]GGI74743.1 aspartate aminotransferase [Vulcanisaeta souniana JCM 11219]